MKTIERSMVRIFLLGLGFSLLLLADTSVAQTGDSLDIKIGQMLLIGFPTSAVDSAVLEEVKKGKVGSIIIFEKNIPPVNSFIELKKIIWTYQKAAPIPLIIGIDQEGGRVNRLKMKYGFPNSITAADMAKSSTLDSARIYAEATASTLAGMGININFAPVVDLAINPDNPIIAKYGRAFSSQEDSVVLLAKEYIKQHRKYNVFTSLKHFPGHGSSKDDTHLGIADVTNTWQERELEPYRQLIDSGYADAVMTSHIVNRKLDTTGNPGTLSTEVITGILRRQLHFNGVVFTDDMQMRAIAQHYGLEEAIKLAIYAGVDIMTFSNNIAGENQRTVARVHEIIRHLVDTGAVTRSRIDESFRRVMALKSRLNEKDMHAEYLRSIEVSKTEIQKAKNIAETAEQETKDLIELVGKKRYKKLMAKKNKKK